jgi:hypothetical protein
MIEQYSKTGRNREIPRKLKNLASRQEPIFLRIDWVRLQFHDRLPS